MKLKALIGSGIIVGSLAVSSVAGAAVTFDPDSGTGFVGKGDVQLAFGWSNKQLQDNASNLAFSYEGTTVTVSEQSWVCTNPKNENTQERERTTTTTSTTRGVVSAVARERNQITGFNLDGFGSSSTTTEASATEGQQLNSCPNNWTLTTSAGAPEVESTSTGELKVSFGQDSHTVWPAA